MSEKKMVRRSVAIALGIVCIILVAALGVVTFMGYSPTATNSVSSLQSKINQLQTWLDGNKTLLSQTQTWLNGNVTDYETQISSLNARITQLQTWLDGNITAYNSLQSTHTNYVNDHHHSDEEYNSLQGIVNLQDSTVWVNAQTQSQPAGGFGFAHTTWTESASYAGYVTVYIASATTTIYVDLIYSSHGVQYTKEVNVGTMGTAVFPVLPATITIEVGNRDLVLGSTETVTITYYY
jgi:hypothetical protein